MASKTLLPIVLRVCLIKGVVNNLVAVLASGNIHSLEIIRVAVLTGDLFVPVDIGMRSERKAN